jgi:hypothetical protein
VIRRLVKTAVPLSRVGMALWAWRNRDELLRWTIFAANAVPRLVEGEGGDVAVEARLRAKLTADPRTRGAPGLQVNVEDGLAILTGVVDPPVHDLAVHIATATAGVTRVRDDLQDYERRPKFASSVERS